MRLPSADAREPHASLYGLKVTWLGHATFLMTSPRGLRLLFDPWLTTNPSCPAGMKRVGAVDLMLISHGHSDHCEDAVTVARETGATVVAPYELCDWLERQGLKNLKPMNIGGRLSVSGIEIVMVHAIHSSSGMERDSVVYLGPAAGFIVRFEDGLTIYFAGDTALFGDMRLIRDRYAPQIGFLPIGDRYTMGPEDAAIAAEWLGVKTIVPMHYGTFAELTGTPAALRGFTGPKGVDVLELVPGRSFA